MGRACGSCLVASLIAFNVIFLLIGTGILCFAIYCYVDTTIQSAISQSGHGDKVQNLLYGLIGVGSLTIIVSIFGCCGAYHESACVLGTYFTCLIIMFGVELAVGALCLVFRVETESRINKALENVIMSFKDDTLPGNNGMTSSYRDLIQRVIQCCGIYGVDDYVGPNIPSSCCIPGHNECPKKSAAFNVADHDHFTARPQQRTIWNGYFKRTYQGKVWMSRHVATGGMGRKQGCKQVTNELVHKKFLTAIALIMSVPLVKVFGLVCALLLCCILRRRDMIEYTEVNVEA
ncbi:Tetraspanin [Paragonimus heterotremus]|uniref:Tetraspanin n=1 Tax=Paragonimus heterotremus TaxID=100268 RepID=A0A8J4WJ44_9TREM|nr:Tetraspanin [Paragonimus heterotremus]